MTINHPGADSINYYQLVDTETRISQLSLKRRLLTNSRWFIEPNILG